MKAAWVNPRRTKGVLILGSCDHQPEWANETDHGSHRPSIAVLESRVRLAVAKPNGGTVSSVTFAAD